ncbi:MAG: Holliday junction branch migration protein RuvA [Bacteroidota bacterium]
MIAYIKGKLAIKEPTFVVIDVNGLGYQVNISLNTFGSIKDQENCHLYTYLHVKEDAHTLYGFSSEADKKVFLDLISISGVGPNTALVVQSSLSAAELKHAIVNEQVKVIQGVKGIGAKTAQRIILELKDKMKKDGLLEDAQAISSPSHNTIRTEALSALTTLGVAKAAAEKSIDLILKKSENGNISLEELIKLALKNT